ncbi:hypothetical protein ACSMFR_02350 [Listeria aquatica]|uniref:hypothetical protein n=1 Tax=Listeria aquatica TaxID=1494960 RepID=UPI003F6F19C5
MNDMKEFYLKRAYTHELDGLLVDGLRQKLRELAFEGKAVDAMGMTKEEEAVYKNNDSFMKFYC